MYTRVDINEVWHISAVMLEVAEALRRVRETIADAGPGGWAVTHDLPSRVGAALEELDVVAAAGAVGGEALSSHYAVAAQGYQDADVLRRPR